MPALSARTQTRTLTRSQPQLESPRSPRRPWATGNVSKPNHNTSAANFSFECLVRSLATSTSKSASASSTTSASLGLGYQYCFPIKLIIGQQQLWPRRTQVDARVAHLPRPLPPFPTGRTRPLSGCVEWQPKGTACHVRLATFVH